MSVVSVTGIPVPQDQKIPFRREVTEWWNDPETAMERTLFIKALTNFQAVPVNQELSYYQIAGMCILAICVHNSALPDLTSTSLGIHGYPAQPWNNQGHAGELWFCTHNKVTFPTWHRPYMALYEVKHTYVPSTALADQLSKQSTIICANGSKKKFQRTSRAFGRRPRATGGFHIGIG
jgi:hypothetical protein